MTTAYDIVPVGGDLWWLYLVMGLGAVVLFGSFFMLQNPTIQAKRPAWSITLARVVILLGGAVLLFGAVDIYKESHGSVVLKEDKLVVDAGWIFPYETPYSNLDIAGAKITSFKEESRLRFKTRKFGTGAPGFLAGWFITADNKDAYVLISHFDKIVYIPTKDDKLLVFSLKEPKAFLEDLKTRTTTSVTK